jgi:hypothetical protein
MAKLGKTTAIQVNFTLTSVIGSALQAHPIQYSIYSSKESKVAVRQSSLTPTTKGVPALLTGSCWREICTAYSQLLRRLRFISCFINFHLLISFLTVFSPLMAKWWLLCLSGHGTLSLSRLCLYSLYCGLCIVCTAVCVLFVLRFVYCLYCGLCIVIPRFVYCFFYVYLFLFVLSVLV